MILSGCKKEHALVEAFLQVLQRGVISLFCRNEVTYSMKYITTIYVIFFNVHMLKSELPDK